MIFTMDDIVVGMNKNINIDFSNSTLYCQNLNGNFVESYTICEIIKIINELTCNPQNDFKKRKLLLWTF